MIALFENPIVLALLAALGFGIGDFIGGRAANRVGASTTVFGGQVVAALLLTALFIGSGVPWPSDRDILIGIIAGSVDGAALMLLYHGLAHGRTSVVASLTGIIAVVLPVLLEVFLIRVPPYLAFAGMALAMIAIVILSQSKGPENAARPMRFSVVTGVLAGITFGLTSFLIGLAEGATATVAIVRIVAVAVSFLTLLYSWNRPVLTLSSAGLVIAAGLLDGFAMLFYVLAATQGLIGISASLLSLNIGVIVLLGYVFLGDTIDRRQIAGLLVGAAAIVLLASSHG